MYGIFTYIYHKDPPNVGIYTIHGWYGKWPTTQLMNAHHDQLDNPYLMNDCTFEGIFFNGKK